jgi:Rieske Fe-S protein
VSQREELSRRDFMRIGTWTIAGVIGLGLAIPGLVYIIAPILQRKETQDWVRVGSAAKVELGTPTLFKVNVERQTGWVVNEEELSVYVLTDDGRRYIAMSSICTHLGCRVRWIPDRDLFFCPCHNAHFDKRGLVISGPPPRPLDRYDVKVEDDQLYILVGG